MVRSSEKYKKPVLQRPLFLPNAAGTLKTTPRHIIITSLLKSGDYVKSFA